MIGREFVPDVVRRLPFDSPLASLRLTNRSLRTFSLIMACHERSLRFAEGKRKLSRMERETGIEPATSSLGSSRSTAELLPLSSADSTPGALKCAPTLAANNRQDF